MTDRRLSAEQVEVLIAPDNTPRRTSAEQVEVLVAPDNAPRRIVSEQVEVLVAPNNAQRVVDAMFVEVLIPVVEASPVPLGIVAVGAPSTAVQIKHTDGVWRVLRNRPLG